MATEITFDQVRQVRMGWTRRLAKSLLEQFRSPQLFIGVDIIPEVWISRKIARRQYWEGR